MKRALAIIGMLVFALAAGTPLAATTIPTDRDAFTQYVAGKLRAAMPNKSITIEGPLEIKVDTDHRVFLDRIFDACHRAPDICERVTETFVAGTVESERTQEAPVTAAMLRVTVRTQEYLREYSRLLRKDARTMLAMRDLVGDLVVICVVDFPMTTRPAIDRDLEALHMTKEEALTRALANMAADLPPPSADNEMYVERGIGLLGPSAYESSRLALHDSWAGLARSLGGKLLVSAPGAELMLFAKDKPGALELLAGATRHMAQTSERPLSTAVYRWTETGWEVAAP